jgi:hypothetical protein
MRRLLLLALAVVALAIPTVAGASVHRVSVTSPIHHGAYATLTVSVSSPATCSIVVNYKSGPSHAQGLFPKRSVRDRVSWTWKVGTNTTPGRWGIVVSCGHIGTLRTSFVVT